MEWEQSIPVNKIKNCFKIPSEYTTDNQRKSVATTAEVWGWRQPRQGYLFRYKLLYKFDK